MAYALKLQFFTRLDQESRSQHLFKVILDILKRLDLNFDWFRLLKHPCLVTTNKNTNYHNQQTGQNRNKLLVRTGQRS